MDKLFNITSTVVAALGGILGYIFGGFDIMMKVLIAFVVLDYVTGVIKAIYSQVLSSEVGFKGICKKVMIFLVVATAFLLQQVLGNTIPFRELVICFFIANEGISILENASVMLPIPQKLKDALIQLRDKSNGEKGEKE